MKKIALSLFVVAASGAYVWAQSGRSPTDDFLRTPPPAPAVQPDDRDRPASAPPASGPVAVSRPTVPIRPDVPEPLPDRAPPGGKPLASAQPVDPPRPPQPEAPMVAAMPPPETPVPAPAPVLADVAAALPPPPPARVPSPRLRPAHDRAGVGALVTRASMTVGGGYVDGTYAGPAVDAYYGLIQIAAIVQGGRLEGIKVLKYPSDRRTSIYINRQALPLLQDEVISAQSAEVDIISGATLTSRAFIRSLDAALQKARS